MGAEGAFPNVTIIWQWVHHSTYPESTRLKNMWHPSFRIFLKNSCTLTHSHTQWPGLLGIDSPPPSNPLILGYPHPPLGGLQCLEGSFQGHLGFKLLKGVEKHYPSQKRIKSISKDLKIISIFIFFPFQSLQTLNQWLHLPPSCLIIFNASQPLQCLEIL